MSGYFLRFPRLNTVALGVCLVSVLSLQTTGLAQGARESLTIRRWQSPARLHHQITTAPGVLIFDPRGIHFQPSKGAPLDWTFIEVQTFYLTPRELRLKTYTNRGWRLPGVKTFWFTLASEIPAPVAAELAACVGKPSRNADPDRSLPAFAKIRARHPTLLGGSNGVLRFRQDGIDYVAAGTDSRSWRWADIQTIASPDLYHFQVDGYRETFNFELKAPMPQALFDRLWDYIYGRDLQLGIHRSHGADNVRPRATNEALSGGQQNAAPPR